MPRIGLVGTAIAAGAASLAAFAGGGAASGAAPPPRAPAPVTRVAAPADCQLRSPSNRVKHVIQVQFDNTHLKRDFPNVLSDLEQMPNLLRFVKQQGTLLDDDHTILIAHTAGGILSTLTGLYPDRNGQTVSNSYDWFGAAGKPAFTSSFKYWTDPVDPASPGTDPLPNMVNGDSGSAKTTPAPWVTFTRAGCDVGEVSMANTVLENTSTAPNGDITKVFGPGSPEFLEASSSDPAMRAKAQTDFVGIAVHCAQTSTLCSSSPNARPDLLPDEPGGYSGFDGLFGARYVNPAIAGGAAVVDDLDHNPIVDPAGNPGFPGFDAMSASVSLGYVAQMQEAGIPITYAYISDAHDNHHDASGRNVAFGPGEAGYVAQLHAYDTAFGQFFTRLAKDGITPANTLFVFTVDEGDHFAGMPPKSCDGQTTACTYTHANWAPGQPLPANQIGEVNATIGSLLPTGEPPFDIHFDSAPNFYVNGQPGRTDPTLRQLERDVAAAKAIDPYDSLTSPTPITQYLVDTRGEEALHMINADPLRTPSFTLFANPDFFLQTTATACGAPVCVDYHFAWNHGDAQPEIARTWVGLVGPGVRAGGGRSPFTDHTDVRPTVLDLVGLHDGYASDGRIVTQALQPAAIPAGLRRSQGLAEALGAALKQLDAPFGAFGHAVLVHSTAALRSGSAADDATYTTLEGRIADLTARRDALVAQIRAVLASATASGTPIDGGTAARLLVASARLLHDAG
jgi:hypothetical protein